jgi:AraC-like DNA-binding protein
VLKGISVTEFNMFVHMAPKYFKFMTKVIETDSPTIITKIVGLYKISHSRRLLKHTEYVVAMENFSYGYPPGQMYDLKGIFRRRYNQGDRNSYSVSNVQVSMNVPVLLDGNLAERIPVPVSQTDLDVIETAIQNDTSFLCRAGVIDYSIVRFFSIRPPHFMEMIPTSDIAIVLHLCPSQLLRFDEDKRRVVVGLIDYLHQFDFLKKMESTSKASLTFRNPTVVSPLSYRRRFLNAMHRYFFGIERELEVRVRRRATTSAASRLRLRPQLRESAPSTPEADHVDIAKQLARNLELAGGSLVSSTSTLPLRRATQSEMSIPKYETHWTSDKPRGHSISSARRPCFDGSRLNLSTPHSEGDECSPDSSQSGGADMALDNSFYSSDMAEETHSHDDDEHADAVGLPLSLLSSDPRGRQLSR